MKFLKFIKNIFLICLLFAIITCGLMLYKGYTVYEVALEEKSIQEMISQVKEKESYTKISELPEYYKKAVLSVEDRRFYSHNGIDIISIARALKNDIQAGSFVEGGSTITQQLAKNTYFTQEKKLERKIAEMFMAFKIESECEKDEILELYLNTSYFGEGCYTVYDASKRYFNKEPIDMNLDEATMLAGIPNAPSVYAPTVNPELAKQRQRQVLDKMLEYGEITLEQAQEIMN
ncbi:MAG: transglycosylase domain-containing protein [Clostridia bacterium]|nr:transglycosylase domain-containing protein [Clostridia bacterium]